MDRAVSGRSFVDGGGGRVNAVWERLAPFFAIKETGIYTLAPAEELDAGMAAHAISRAIGAPVDGIQVLSWNAMMSGMSRGARADRFTAAGVTLRDGLWLRLIREHVDALELSLGGIDEKQAFYSAFDRDLGGGLRRIFEERFRPVLGGFRWLNITCTVGDLLLLSAWNGVEETLYYGAAFASVGDARAERLAPLGELLLRAIPLCESENRPGVWIVIAG